MSEQLTGGCACGKVRYELASLPMFTHCCHCLECQRQSGSAFAINGLIEAGRIEILSGVPMGTPLPTESGKPHIVYRCPDCQTVVWSDYGAREYLLFLRIGTLDNPQQVSPDVHIFTRSKLDWVHLPEQVPAFDVFYDMKALWPPEALARRQAASDAAKGR